MADTRRTVLHSTFRAVGVAWRAYAPGGPIWANMAAEVQPMRVSNRGSQIEKMGDTSVYMHAREQMIGSGRLAMDEEGV